MSSVNRFGVDRSAFMWKMGMKPMTASLFHEKNTTDVPAPYCLAQDGPPGCVSLRKVYMEVADPTEYNTAIELLGSWAHWEVLKNCTWFKPHLESLRAELQAKLLSENIGKYLTLAQKGDPAAIKWAANKGFIKEETSAPKPRRGRPTREEIEAEVGVMASEEKATRDDAVRLGLQD